MDLGEHSGAARTVREYGGACRWSRAETDVFVVIAGSKHPIRKSEIVSSVGYSDRAVGMALHGLKERGLIGRDNRRGYGLTNGDGNIHRDNLNKALVALGEGEGR